MAAEQITKHSASEISIASPEVISLDLIKERLVGLGRDQIELDKQVQIWQARYDEAIDLGVKTSDQVKFT